MNPSRRTLTLPSAANDNYEIDVSAGPRPYVMPEWQAREAREMGRASRRAANDNRPLPQAALGATPELKEHHRIAPTTVYHEDGAGRPTLTIADRNRDFDTLAWLRDRGHIGHDHAAAGASLRRDWYLAGREQLRAIDPGKESTGTPSTGGEPESKLDAEVRLGQVRRSLGATQYRIAIEVCTAGKRVRDIERHFGTTRTHGTTLITLVLERLAEHYFGVADSAAA